MRLIPDRKFDFQLIGDLISSSLAVFWAVPGNYGLTASKMRVAAIGRTYRNDAQRVGDD
jgi:hypothetical protein